MKFKYEGLGTYKRQKDGKFSSFKSGLKRLLRGLVRLTVVTLVFVGCAAYIGAQYFSDTVVAVNEVTVDTTPAKIDGLKADVIDRLLACESAGHKEDDAIIMYDNNKAGSLKGKNVFSLGQLQFKVPTVQHYVTLRDGKQITQKEAVLIALDTVEARKLATWIIFETENGAKDWYNCNVKLGLEAEIKIIKRLAE